jgi:hypothetical protein
MARGTWINYCKVEGVSTDDLMRMWGRVHARCDERVGTLDGELRACESKHVLRRGRLRQERAGGESVPMHSEGCCCEGRSGRRETAADCLLLILKSRYTLDCSVNLELEA